MLARLNLFIRCVVKCIVYILKLLFVARNGRRSWLASVTHDLAYVAFKCDKLSEMRGAHIRVWANTIRSRPGSFKQLFKSALSQPRLQLKASWATTAALKETDAAFSCHLCDYDGAYRPPFKSHQALAVHMCKQHGIRHIAHVLVDTTHCPICLLQFHSRVRLLAHLMEKNPFCLNQLKRSDPVITQDQAMELDKANGSSARALKGASRKPVFRLQGPLVLAYDENGVPIITPGNHHPHGIGRQWH